MTSTDGDPTTTSASSTTSDEGDCGDGVINGDEECDDGPANADDALCTSSCIAALCGDGLLQLDNEEECDDGPANDNGAACTAECKKASCGDGFVWEGHEECDHGPENKAGVYKGCTPMTCTKGPHCGDEIINGDEECDEGEDKNGLDGYVCTESCMLDGKIVFVTSAIYIGALGGLAGADDKCNTLAMVAGVANAGNFMAWLSDDKNSPATRMEKHDKRYVLLDGTIVAESWSDLTDGVLSAKINVQENGEVFKDGHTWTGTKADGTSAGATCNGWTDGTVNAKGLRGDITALDFKWTAQGAIGCFFESNLVCVEQ